MMFQTGMRAMIDAILEAREARELAGLRPTARPSKARLITPRKAAAVPPTARDVGLGSTLLHEVHSWGHAAADG